MMRPGCAAGPFVEPDARLALLLQTARLDGKIERLFGNVEALSRSLGDAVAKGAPR